MRKRLSTGFALGILLLFLSCQVQREQKQGLSKGYIEFREKSFSFGEVKHGDVIGHSFKCYNTGSEPVTILHVKKSCGCTDVKYSQKPVLPGDSTYVEVVFDTRGWRGRQVKQIRVLSNDSIGERELRVWADVK